MNILENVVIHLPSKLNKLPIIEYTKDTLILGHMIKKGFKTDCASIPWIFRRIFPSMSAYAQAAIIHDVKCVKANYLRSYRFRRLGDMEFYLNCVDKLGRPKLEAMFLYAGVSIGSFIAYFRYKL